MTTTAARRPPATPLLAPWRAYLARAIRQREAVVLGLVIVQFCAFAAFADGFATSSNLANVLRNATELALISAGMTLIIIQGAIDVSVGSILGVVAFAGAKMLSSGVSPVLTLIACMVLGAALGTINGLLVTAGRIPSIIATLGTMNIWRAVIFILLGGQILTGIPSLSPGLESASLGSVPLLFGLVIVIYAVLWYLLHHRVFGRTLYAVGNNEEAARLAGLAVRRSQLTSFALLGLLIGLAALTYLMRVPSVEVTIGQDFALLAIAAVVIGGASITGGSGSIIGTFLGVLFVVFLRNGLVVLGVPSLWEPAALGAFILISVGADHFIYRRRQRRTAAVGH